MEHLVQLHAFYREKDHPGEDRNGHLQLNSSEVQWSSEGKILFHGTSGLRLGEYRQWLSLKGMDSNQTT